MQPPFIVPVEDDVRMLAVGLNVPLVALEVNVPEKVTGYTVTPEATAAPFIITAFVVVDVLSDVSVATVFEV